MGEAERGSPVDPAYKDDLGRGGRWRKWWGVRAARPSFWKRRCSAAN